MAAGEEVQQVNGQNWRGRISHSVLRCGFTANTAFEPQNTQMNMSGVLNDGIVAGRPDVLDMRRHYVSPVLFIICPSPY